MRKFANFRIYLLVIILLLTFNNCSVKPDPVVGEWMETEYELVEGRKFIRKFNSDGTSIKKLFDAEDKLIETTDETYVKSGDIYYISYESNGFEFTDALTLKDNKLLEIKSDGEKSVWIKKIK